MFRNVTRQVLSRSATEECSFDIGNGVMVRDYRVGHSRRQPARVLAKLGNKSYRVETDGGSVGRDMLTRRIENGIADIEPE